MTSDVTLLFPVETNSISGRSLGSFRAMAKTSKPSPRFAEEPALHRRLFPTIYIDTDGIL